MDHVVLRKWHIMAGCDVHNELTFSWPPLPAPNTPHVVGMRLAGFGGATMTTDAVVAQGWNIVKRDSDISYGIIHVPIPPFPPLVLLPLIIATAGSKSYFGPSSVVAQGSPIACALFTHVSLNLNCADPCPMPTGIVAAWGTVVCGMTWGDIIGGFIAGALDCAIQALINYATGKGANALYRDVITRAAKSASVAIARLGIPLISAAMQQLLGSPVGYTNAPGRADGSLANPGNWGTAGGHAIGDAISGRHSGNDPATEQH